MAEEWNLVDNKFSKEVMEEFTKVNSHINCLKTELKMLLTPDPKQQIDQKSIAVQKQNLQQLQKTNITVLKECNDRIDEVINIQKVQSTALAVQNSKIDRLTQIIEKQNRMINNLLNYQRDISKTLNSMDGSRNTLNKPVILTLNSTHYDKLRQKNRNLRTNTPFQFTPDNNF
jgi:DNA repair ATPase RecN